MFLFTLRDANGGDAAQVVYHEITHGLVGRTITNAAGDPAVGPLQTGMMNEGWADFFSTDLLMSQGLMTDTPAPGEIRLGTHVVGPGGIRAKPTDCPVAPAGVAGCNANGTATAVLGGYTFGDLKNTDNTSPHNGGELWAETLWDLRTAIGRDATLKLVAGGMRLTADNPSFLDARDAILLQAAATRSAPGAADDYYDEVWETFRARGMGFDATTPSAASTAPVESFSEARNVLDAGTPTVRDPYPEGDNDGLIEAGEGVDVSLPLFARGVTDLAGVTGTLSSPAAGVTILDGTAAWPPAGRGRTVANGDPLVARMPASCDGAVPLRITTTSAVGGTDSTVQVQMRPTANTPVKLADRVDGGPVAVTEATFEVAGSGVVSDVNVRIDDLRHTWLGDLVIQIVHAGETVTLLDGPDTWGAANIVNMVFDSDSATPVRNSGLSALSGVSRPQDPAGLDRFDGKPAGGTWTLRISDTDANDTGVLNAWAVDGPRPEFPCPRLEIPAATTGDSSSITSTGAEAEGAIDPNGRATGLRFAYGTTTGYGSATAVQPLGAGDEAVTRSDVLTGLEPGTTYHYRVEAIREGGVVAVGGADRTFTTAPAPVTPQPRVSPTPGPSADRTAPAFTGKPKVTLAKAGKKHRRATFAYVLSEPATVSAVVTRAAPGIKKGKQCVAVPTRKPKGAKSCTRQLSAARGSANAGARTLALPAKGLGKGRYTATLTATDTAGNRSTATVTFTIR